MKRLKYIDCIKGLSIILVVLGHVLYGEEDNVICNYIYSFHLPLFFMISGYLLAYKDSWKNRDLKQNVKSICWNLLYPYCTFSVLGILITFLKNVFFQEFSLNSMLTNILNAICLEGYLTLWFLPALLFGEILFIIVNNIKKSKKIIYIFIFIITIIGAYVINSDVIIVNQTITKIIFKFWNIVNRALVGTLFIYIGYSLYYLIERKQYNNTTVIICSCGIILMNLFISQLNGFVDLHFSIIGNPILYYYCALSTSIAIILIFKNLNIKNNVLQFFGKNSLIVMATHLPFQILAISRKVVLIQNHVVYNIIVFLIVIFVESILILLINKYFPYIIKRQKGEK